MLSGDRDLELADVVIEGLPTPNAGMSPQAPRFLGTRKKLTVDLFFST